MTAMNEYCINEKRAGNVTPIVVFLIMTLLTGCIKKSLEYDLDIKETIVININTEPPTLDWSKSTDTTSHEIQKNIMDGLADYDLYDLDLPLRPLLAEKWESTNKAKTWRVTLRKGVKWTDGVEFEAQHVIDGWKRLLHPMTASEYAYFIFNIQGAKEYNSGEFKDFSKVGVKAVNKYELLIELKKSMNFFPHLLAHHSTYPIRLDIVNKYGEGKWTEAKNIVTLGPFILKVWEHDKAIVLERNENYWGEKPKVKNVLAYMINEESTAISLFESGKLDYQKELPSTEISILKQKPEFVSKGNLLLYYYGFNVMKKPFDDVNVRKAFVHAIDRDEVTRMLGGGESPTSNWIPKGMSGYNQSVGLKFDPKKAKEYLKKAGYEKVEKMPKVVIGFNTTDNHKRIAENIQQQLKKHLSISVELKNEEWKVYLSTLNADPYPIFRLGWMADYPHPNNFMSLMLSYSDNNRGRWVNKKYDALIEAAVSEMDSQKRLKLYNEAQKIMLEEDAAVIPIYSGVRNQLISNRLKDFPVNVMDQRVYTRVSIQ